MLTVPGGKTYSFKPYEFEEASIAVYVNTEGFGQIITYKPGEREEFVDGQSMNSSYIGLAEPETYVFEAKADDEWKFKKWTKNGENFSTENPVTVELTESAEYVAVFGRVGRDETHVDLSTVTKLGQVLGLPDYGSGTYDDIYVYAFEQDDSYYRAIAKMPESVRDAYYALDFDDPEYEKKSLDIIKDLDVIALENLSEMTPDQAMMDSCIGKTLGSLIDSGWYCDGWNLEDMIFYMNNGVFRFNVGVDAKVDDPYAFDEEDMMPLVIKTIEYEGLGDYTNLDPEQYK